MNQQIEKKHPAVAALRKRIADRFRMMRKQMRSQAAETEKFKQLSFYDELTGILNRRGGMEEIELITADLRNIRKEGERRKHAFHGIVIGLFDIDIFKGINDRFGHDVGDVVLKETALFLKGEFRSYCDIVCRWGGEEFLVAFQGDKKDLFGKSFSLNVKIGKEQIRVTLSGGVTNYRPGEKLEEAIKRADGALYSSKKNGRYRITVCD